ncbi:ubiquinone/menaquinone biosynthesis C-methylase UbiE [Flavobacterium gossypii]|uniref:Ubiquinone/menaquinone biosynthesis C-methylase UbiE n=1 Tax=Flavobacterium gossypii TaxID=1646119 RepID=A0ABR6DSE6_9FLAO|nr:class I SAM-dependent methyltransferase [Flavobacterium gossypii]MBA9074617.1 ubiquinone/menaquinone biosynthesis C-methylase UbiE [Flavobacterium gossypii]
MKNWTGERLETFVYNRIAIEHLHRYSIATEYCSDKIVLDIACGEGYGSHLMSEKASFVYGVDIDNECISQAKLKYKKQNIEFLVGSTSKIPLEDNSVDIVVSYETIEHHDEHDEMMTEIKRVLKPNGLLIISTPDKLYYSDMRKLENEFHVKELYKEEFSDLASRYFSQTQLLSQIYNNGNSMVLDEQYLKELKFFSGDYAAIREKKWNALFLIIIACDGDFKRQNISVFDGGSISKKELVNEIQNSATYKAGHFILSPFKFLKRKLK